MHKPQARIFHHDNFSASSNSFKNPKPYLAHQERKLWDRILLNVQILGRVSQALPDNVDHLVELFFLLLAGQHLRLKLLDLIGDLARSTVGTRSPEANKHKQIVRVR